MAIQIDTVMGGTEVVRRFSELSPDVLVLDPEARIVFYSQFDQDHIVREAYRIGGMRGGTYFMPDIAERLALMSVRGDEHGWRLNIN